MSSSVVHRAPSLPHAVYQPDAKTELYVPVIVAPSPGGPETYIIPASKPVFRTLKEAWGWHLAHHIGAVETQHMQIDANNANVLELLRKQAGNPESMRALPYRIGPKPA